MTIKFIILGTLVVAAVAAASPNHKTTFWQGTPLDSVVEQMRSNCDTGLDSMSCIKLKMINFLDTVFRKDNYQISNDIEVRSNGYENINSARSSNNFIDNVLEYIQRHDFSLKLPVADTEITIQPRNIDNDELGLNIKFAGGSTESRKSKLKKIAVPIMVFVLLKAMTLIPLALGILGLKAWNALQLGFISFIVSVGLAIFQLCKKISTDHHHPHIAAHGPWDRRSFLDNPIPEAQNIAYNAYS